MPIHDIECTACGTPSEGLVNLWADLFGVAVAPSDVRDTSLLKVPPEGDIA
jgi:hypothetical protein